MKTAELTGAALDWAVSKCEGVDVTHLYAWDYSRHKYSTDWAQGGPIIELEEITIAWGKDTEDWWACVGDSRRFDTDTPDGVTTFVDPQPLIAAMRCYVASKLGDEVEIPEGLEL